MTTSYTLNVFTDTSGRYGDPVSIIIDENRKLDAVERQLLTKKIGNPETVFINDISAGDVSIFSLQQEIPFAGQPMIGAAWLLSKLRGQPISTIHSMGRNVTTRQEDDRTWIWANLEIMPPWHHLQVDGVDAVARINKDEAAAMEHTMVWAWVNKDKGVIRARTFASDWDIPEAESNGSGAMLLAAQLNRKIEVIHGKGSVIYARGEGIEAAIGGRIKEGYLRAGSIG